MRELVLRNGQLEARVLPDIGGGLARLDWLGFDGAAGLLQPLPLPLLRPWLGASDVVPRPNQLACSVLLPWSNRIGGGFSFAGRSYSIAPNRAGEPYAIHGEGATRAWQVVDQSSTHAQLALDRSDGAPFCYQAQLTYRLDGATLAIALEVRNVGDVTLPYGMGLHPWMARTDGVTLRAGARSVWRAAEDKLPLHPMAIPAAWSFAQARALPAEAIDHVFEGWDGSATIVWPEHGLGLSIQSDCGYYIVYAPTSADFFCIEPVDHLINAHNVDGGPERHGLTLLAPGQSYRRQFRFTGF